MVDTGLNIENYNDDFLILKSENKNLLAGIARSIFEKNVDFVSEVIIAETEVCIQLNDRFDESKLGQLNLSGNKSIKKPRSFKLPIYFNEHTDWNGILKQTGLSRAETILKILESTLSVAMFGFLPGFVYLDGLDPDLHVTRKAIPSKYVSAGSVAIGGKYLGIYSIDSPGGWHVIGQIPLSILNIQSLPPVDFDIGDTLELEAINQEQFDQIVKAHTSFMTYNS